MTVVAALTGAGLTLAAPAGLKLLGWCLLAVALVVAVALAIYELVLLRRKRRTPKTKRPAPGTEPRPKSTSVGRPAPGVVPAIGLAFQGESRSQPGWKQSVEKLPTGTYRLRLQPPNHASVVSLRCEVVEPQWFASPHQTPRWFEKRVVEPGSYTLQLAGTAYIVEYPRDFADAPGVAVHGRHTYKWYADSPMAPWRGEQEVASGSFG